MINRGCPNKNDSIVSAMLFLFYQLVYHNVLWASMKMIYLRFSTAKADKFAV